MRGRQRLLTMLAVSAALTAIVIVGYAVGAMASLELSSVDTRFALRGTQQPRRQVVVVGIDQPTFNELGLRWPFPRRYDGQMITRLKQDGARVIVYDVQFTEQSDSYDDDALINAVGNAGNVVLATDAALPGGQTAILGGNAELRSLHALPGDSLFPNDADGKIRRMYYEQSGLKTLAVAAAERYSGRPVAASDFPGNSAWIDYAGPPGAVTTESFSKVLEGRVPASVFAGKVVVVGATEPTLQDIHPTATTSGSNLMSGAEIQANAITTILDGFPLDGIGWAGDVALIVLLGMVPAALNLRLRPVRAFLAAVGAGGVFTLLAQLLFDSGVIVSYVYPLLALALSSVGALAVNFMAEAFERERVRDVFSRFISDAVVDQVLESSADGTIRLGGVRLESTLLFSDLRGFTSFAEALPPERVIEILNRYLTAMSDAILDHGGTLVAYMGDGIMAVFGAPIAAPNHADAALAAARDMLRRLKEFNAWLRSEGLGDGFKMGIGLNTGPVMSGHVGSERRLEYTAIGDTTNTASRLEGMTKGTPYQLYVADATRAQLAEEPPDLVFVDEFEVRGKQATIKVWGLAE